MKKRHPIVNPIEVRLGSFTEKVFLKATQIGTNEATNVLGLQA